jgi:hypothetical protein
MLEREVDGAGEDPFYLTDIVGIPRGPLLAYGTHGLYIIEGSSWSHESIDVWDIYIVNENLAYGVLIDDPRLVYFDGSTWGPFPGDPLPYQVNIVWADEEAIFCAGVPAAQLRVPTLL